MKGIGDVTKFLITVHNVEYYGVYGDLNIVLKNIYIEEALNEAIRLSAENYSHKVKVYNGETCELYAEVENGKIIGLEFI